MVKKGELFNAYSSYFNILENVGQYPQGDANRLILLSFLEQMKADGFYKTLSAEDRKVIDKIIDCIRKKLCILPYTSACMKKKAEKVYIGEYEDCIFYNKTVPQYEDMNPSWEDTGYSCRVNSQGYRNGIKVTHQSNINPLYKGVQTKDVVTIDTVACTLNTPNWQQVGTPYCEQSGGDNTGYLITEYKDVNPYSSTYNVIDYRKTLNVDQCPIPDPGDSDPVWAEVSRSCEMITYEYSPNPEVAHKTGYANVVQQDVNTHSETYGNERTIRVSDSSTCPEEYVGWLVYSDTEIKARTLNINSAAYNSSLPLSYFINDDLELDWHGNVQEFNGGCPVDRSLPRCIGVDENTKTLLIFIPKNTTGKDRFLLFSVGATYDEFPLYLTVNQTADTVFTWNDSSVSKNLQNVSASGTSVNYSVISTAGGEFHNYSVYSASSGVTANINGSSVTVIIAQNSTTSARNLTLKLRQADSNNDIQLNISQKAADAPQPQPVEVFTVTPSSYEFESNGGTITIQVTSTVDGVFKDYSYVNNFSNANVTKNGNTLTIVAASTESALSGNIVLTQNDTLNTATVTLTQKAPVYDYVFSWNSGIEDPYSIIIGNSAEDYIFPVISTRNSVSYPYSVDSCSVAGWTASVDENNELNVHVTKGQKFTDVNGTIVLKQMRQNSTFATLTLNIRQTSEHALAQRLYLTSGTAVSTGITGSYKFTLILGNSDAVMCAQMDILDGTLAIEYKGDSEADNHWEAVSPITYIGNNECEVTVNTLLTHHQWDDHFDVRLIKTSLTATYSADTTPIQIKPQQ